MFFNSSITISNSENFKKFVSETDDSYLNFKFRVNLNLEFLAIENLKNEWEFQAKTHYYYYYV